MSLTYLQSGSWNIEYLSKEGGRKEMETGNRLLATKLAGEWVFRQTGTVDFLMFTLEAENMISIAVAGWVVILLGGVVVGRRRNRARRVS